MYEIPTYVISAILLLAILIAIQLGSVVGKSRQVAETEDSKSQTNAVQGSLLGFLALLLGFTFSLSLARYDQRSIEVVNEANAIGTAWLRTDLLEDDRRLKARELLQQYALTRLAASAVSAANDDERDLLISQAETIFDELWLLASDAAREAGNPVVMSFASSLNDMIDALAARDAAIRRHVPELVLYLLFGTFVMLGGVIGYSSGISNVRPSVPVYAMMILIVVLMFLIIDLDRPRRGLIEVDQSKLVSTIEAMRP